MSYEKLGFEKGQVLKAEHLNHMEDGIVNACSGAPKYYTGEVGFDDTYGNKFTFTEISRDELVNNYCEVEIGLRVNDASEGNAFMKCSFLIEHEYQGQAYDTIDTIVYDQWNMYPKACLTFYDDVCLEIKAGTNSGAFLVYNPSIIYVRLYPKV